MPATPAWPPESAPRLYVTTPLSEGAAVPVDGNAAHYLLHVMRLKAGDAVLLFDGISGEWLARVEEARKRDALLLVERRSAAPDRVPDFWLCVAPIKKARMEWMVEKATELGVGEIHPLLTRRSVVDKVNPDRMTAHMVEAAEQCGRNSLPIFQEIQQLKAFLQNFPEDRHLFFADENARAEGGAPVAEAVASHSGPGAFLIGPEGGFSEEERDLIRAHPQAVPVSLGQFILRAETAAIAATAVWMAQRAPEEADSR